MKNIDQEKQRIVSEFQEKFGYLRGDYTEWSKHSYDEIQSFLAESLDALHAAVVREVGEWAMGYAERVYPADVWIPLSKEKKADVWKAIDDMMIEKFGGRIDTVSAEYARWAINNVAQDLVSTFPPNKDKEE